MNNKIIILLISIFCLSCGTKNAYASLSLDLGCPTSAKVGTGLVVTVKNIKNYNSTAVYLSRYMTGIVANTSNTVGSAGFYGPFAKTFATTKTVPARNPTTYVPGTIANFGVVVATTPNVPNKMAMVFVNFITPDGQEISSDSCLVNIIP